jgi:hypothetical protein
MTAINSIEKSKGNSQALEQIAEDYLHLLPAPTRRQHTLGLAHRQKKRVNP